MHSGVVQQIFGFANESTRNSLTCTFVKRKYVVLYSQAQVASAEWHVWRIMCTALLRSSLFSPSRAVSAARCFLLPNAI
jgi:hypothetical protein